MQLSYFLPSHKSFLLRYTGAGQAFAIIWFYLCLYGATPILFPNPPNRSHCKWTAGYPVVFFVVSSEVIWHVSVNE